MDNYMSIDEVWEDLLIESRGDAGIANLLVDSRRFEWTAETTASAIALLLLRRWKSQRSTQTNRLGD